MGKKLIRNCLFFITSFILFIVIVCGVFFVANPDEVYAMRSVAHIASTLFRFDAEVLSPTAHGRYYSELYWKHNYELVAIVRTYPNVSTNTLRVMHLFMPHIEALLDDRGNEVRISQEQMNELQFALGQFKSLSSEELRKDIEREEERTPLHDFVGMTVDEAMTMIESAWERDFPSASQSIATVSEADRLSKTFTPFPTYSPTPFRVTVTGLTPTAVNFDNSGYLFPSDIDDISIRQTIEIALPELIGEAGFGGRPFCSFVLLLPVKVQKDNADVYLHVVCEEYLVENGVLQIRSGGSVPVALFLSKESSIWKIVDHKAPQSSDWPEGVRKIFPPETWPLIFPSNKDDVVRFIAVKEVLQMSNLEQASAFWNVPISP